MSLFSRYVSRADRDIQLAEAALLIASEVYTDLNVTKYVLWLDAQGYRARERFEPGGSPTVIIGALNELLFGELGFHGNAESYYDERNSYLNEVIERRTGIPITLSLIYMEIGRRAGLNVEGIGLPGHFIVRVRGANWDVLIDPFNRGAELSRADCEQLMAQAYGKPMPLLPQYLTPVTRRAFLTRLLMNLQAIHLQNENWERALAVIGNILGLHPGAQPNPDLLRARGLVRYKLEQWAEAERDWMQYLTLSPDAPEAPIVRQNIELMRQMLARRN